MFGSNVTISPESELGKELAKWNKPYVFQAFPKMLYKARRRPDGIISAAENDDSFFGGRPGAADLWTTANQKIVSNEDELLKAKGQGWCNSLSEAVEQFKAEYDKEATVAAHRAYEDRNMGEKAQEEIKAAEGTQFEHVPEIPEKPKVRKQRSDKGKPRKGWKDWADNG